VGLPVAQSTRAQWHQAGPDRAHFADGAGTSAGSHVAGSGWLEYSSSRRSPALLYDIVDLVCDICESKLRPLRAVGGANATATPATARSEGARASVSAVSNVGSGLGHAAAPTLAHLAGRRGSRVGGDVQVQPPLASAGVPALPLGLVAKTGGAGASGMQQVFARVLPIQCAREGGGSLIASSQIQQQTSAVGAAKHSATAAARISKWFDFFDRNGDGLIRIAELVETLHDIQVRT
jgi:hypothetical protein